MKKFILLLILNLSFLIFHSQVTKAQWVTIPDANFVTKLTQLFPSCMNGNQMDTTCSGIVNATSVFVSNMNISDLTGIEYFDNLNSLYCSDNQLTSLPTLPISLTLLGCSNNQLTSLPALPNSLTELACYSNQLTSLPSMPNSLTSLICYSNQLTSLPSLPNTLTRLWCYINQINTLPTLSDSLVELHCYSNQLTSLPTLPNSLIELFCYSNQLTSLPSLPNSLSKLSLSGTQINSLPTLPISLTELSFSSTQINSLPPLPNSLTKLSCNYNQLTSLPTLPNSLIELSCANNQLTSLPNLPNSLIELFCYSNQLTSLPSLPNSLSSLNCSSNQLTFIPQVPNTMSRFQINNNNISCLNNLPAVSSGTPYGNITNNPLLHCVPNQTNYSLGLPLCVDGDTANNPNGCQSVANIVGNVYTDLNNNCTYNNTDWKVKNFPVKVFDSQNNLKQVSYTVNGVFSFASLPVNTYLLKINDIQLPIDMACGQSNTKTVYLTSTTQSILNNNFPVVCDSAFDMQVHSVTRQGWVFPGQVHTVNTNLANDVNWYNLNCDSTNYSGTVTINVTGPVTYVAPAIGALTPQVSGNTLTYTIANFDSLTPYSFGLKLLTDITAQAVNQICVHVTIATTPTDADTTNNEYDFCYQVVNSYDPNMKEVYPTNVLPGYDDWFTYTIHFQNTGTAPAFNIRLRDTLDTQLDINTFEFLGASHTANTSLNGNILTVRFNNIMLPDSTSDYEGSMGYYQYRVKPLPNITNGSTIENTAYIYFDYNPAIITNTTQNNFDITVGNHVIEKNEVISIYPNPSTGIFTIKSASTIKTIEVFNLIGESVLQQTNGNTINVSSQPPGIYFCKVNGNKVLKLIKE